MIKNYKNSQYLGFEYQWATITIFVREAFQGIFIKMKARIEKTVGMAYSRNSKADVIYKEGIV
jgi:hypothetical protein